ncbi:MULTISPECIES: dihydroxyacetone kinase subunit DhaL [Brucella]|jgi:dihydroxyacetone kinase-like protein|uniref:Dihydroxyacetone kinase subunit L n=2 Tax=Brucella TaxID=234 RepID=A0A656Z651_BRUAN|nr:MULTISPECIES: dihydroxyacetone kinase subunit DhaL [Brucella]EMG52026.1 dihydroxyacetone kinase subunit DhaL [Ochrobactrum sp. CDB2]KYB46147.1 dihydroxyacetone kinase subunit L [Brucella anthropi]MBK0023680.1 dihydroxyacetone kinase subunit L [Ochrobactrum sp. S45]MBK0046451.1 dihydroxyacetone kinase subunit L [Ochrobactrum sp. S46]MCM0752354.1 dihydroxyacetone kinase subunit L [Brucella pseudogrignonensis]
MSETAARRLAHMFDAVSASLEAERDRLSELDGAIGDGDHGTTMALGFQAVRSELSKLNLDETDISTVLNTAATAFINAVGASTGPLYATGFRRAAQATAGRNDLDLVTCAIIIEAIGVGIRERGHGQRGDKTMLDAWLPAAEAAQTAVNENQSAGEFWNRIVSAATAGANTTRSMIAAKGRAARLRERSLGHIDPGAASTVIILQAMAASAKS